MILETKVNETMHQEWQCPACEAGEMKSTGIAYSDGLFQHQCNACAHVADCEVAYPRVVTRSPYA